MSALPLAEVTLGRYLTARAALGLTGASDVCDLLTVPPLGLAAFVGAVCVGRPGKTVETDVADVYGRWRAEAERQYALGARRAKEVSRWNGFAGSADGFGDPPPPETMAGAMDLPTLAAAWDLPLWVVVMQSGAEGSMRAFREYMSRQPGALN